MSTDRKQRIHFHVESQDYFATLATIISFLQESMEAEAESVGKSLREITHSSSALKRIHKDLLYLQQQFTIEKKKDQKA